MRRAALLMVLALGALAFATVTGRTDAKDDKGTEVEIDGLKATTPADWKAEKPSSNLRVAQFRLPKKGEDKDDAEIVIFKGFGGSAQQNVERWKASFSPPKGKTIDDVSKVEEMKVAGRKVTYLDISGTYKFRDPSKPNAKEELRPDYRMLAVQFDGNDTVYHIKLTGPAKTVGAYKKGFDEWLKALK
jgi:hypothetical protein